MAKFSRKLTIFEFTIQSQSKIHKKYISNKISTYPDAIFSKPLIETHQSGVFT